MGEILSVRLNGTSRQQSSLDNTTLKNISSPIVDIFNRCMSFCLNLAFLGYRRMNWLTLPPFSLGKPL